MVDRIDTVLDESFTADRAHDLMTKSPPTLSLLIYTVLPIVTVILQMSFAIGFSKSFL